MQQRTEAAEGQGYDALQQGVPQQPAAPLLVYLPPHKTCVRLGTLSVACPGTACWHLHSADVRRRPTKRSLSLHLRCEVFFTA